MLIVVAIFSMDEWTKWKQQGILGTYYSLLQQDSINAYQVIGDTFIKKNGIGYIIQPDRVHSDQVLKRIAKKLKRNEQIPFLFEGLRISDASNLDEGMIMINEFYKKWIQHPNLYIRSKMELFRQPHWIKHRYSWAKDESVTSSYVVPIIII